MLEMFKYTYYSLAFFISHVPVILFRFDFKTLWGTRHPVQPVQGKQLYHNH